MRNGRVIRWVGLVLIGGLLVVTVRVASRLERHEAERWLARAAAAPRSVAYHGREQVRFAWGNKQMASEVRVAHEPPDRTRLDYAGADLDGVCVITVGEHTWRYDPRLKRTDEATGAATDIPASVAGYRVRVGPGESVAGRATRRIDLTGAGTARTLWLDVQTGLLLRSRTRQPTGQSAETTFVELTLGAPAEPVSYEAPGGATRHAAETLTPAQIAARLGFALAQPKWLPAGFQPAGAFLFRCPCCDMLAGQLTYSNGVAAFSLFEGRIEDASCLATSQCCGTAQSQAACVGATRDDGVVVGRLDRQPVVLAVGELPQTELRRVVDSCY
ncbi:MAG: hypothetical protein HZB16_22380 [Armatimonadetes bacterium]|nr:hypothetical protein [Armatimonadota bacterium]